jgi:hypothetical protein
MRFGRVFRLKRLFMVLLKIPPKAGRFGRVLHVSGMTVSETRQKQASTASILIMGTIFN